MALLRRSTLLKATAYLLAFLALTVPLTWLWETWGREAYGAFFSWVAGGLYTWLGFEHFPLGARERYINFVPFIALMALTPGFGVVRRIAWLFVGLGVLFLSHLVLNLLAAYVRYQGAFSPPLALVSDAMPFLVWAVLARDFLLGLAGSAAGRGEGAEEGASAP